jgi:hypothetical protein
MNSVFNRASMNDNEYINIQKHRFGDRVNCEFLCSEDLNVASVWVGDTNNNLYRIKMPDFLDKLYNYNVDSFDETEFNDIIYADEDLKIKILYDVCNFSFDNSSIIYESYWSGGKLYINNHEKLLYHFVDKENTSFHKAGNSIYTHHKKDLIEDFFWVTYLTENYEKLAKVLLESISNFSSRKCIIYTINYISTLSYNSSEQFIFRRLDISTGDIDDSGRYETILSSKPVILSDVIDFKPNNRFVFVDTDVYLTSTADTITKYFKDIENYPLINSHIHDTILSNSFSPSVILFIDLMSSLISGISSL